MARAIIGPLVLALTLGLAADATAQRRAGGDDRRERRDRMERLRGERDGRHADRQRWRFERRRSARSGRRDRGARRADRRREWRRARRDRSVIDRHHRRGILRRILRERERRHRHGRRGHRVREAPAFCRSGAGHPVFGRRWCHEKGFGLGRFSHRHRDRLHHRRGVRLRSHRHRSLPAIILGRRLHDHRYRRHRHLAHADLAHVLGLAVTEYVLHEVLGLSRYRGRHITGRWHDARYHDRRGAAWWQAGHRTGDRLDPLALQLYLDGERLAELADLDRDGRVDLFLTR